MSMDPLIHSSPKSKSLSKTLIYNQYINLICKRVNNLHATDKKKFICVLIILILLVSTQVTIAPRKAEVGSVICSWKRQWAELRAMSWTAWT